jgi:hypothetical protein
MLISKKILKYQLKLNKTLQSSPKYNLYMQKYMYYISGQNKLNIMTGGSFKCISTPDGQFKTEKDCMVNCNDELTTINNQISQLTLQINSININKIYSEKTQLEKMLSSSEINKDDSLRMKMIQLLTLHTQKINIYNSMILKLKTLNNKKTDIIEMNTWLLSKQRQWISEQQTNPVDNLLNQMSDLVRLEKQQAQNDAVTDANLQRRLQQLRS